MGVPSCLTHEIVPFLSLEWLSILWFGVYRSWCRVGRAGLQRLGSRATDGLVVPVGLMLFSVVSAVWEFATSGLEMGLVFGWIGMSFWLLVRTEQSRRGAATSAFVLGLGPLIRPELLLVSIVFLWGWPGWSRLMVGWVQAPFGAVGCFLACRRRPSCRL